MKILYSFLFCAVVFNAKAQDIDFDQNYAGDDGIIMPAFLGTNLNSGSLGIMVDNNNRSYHFGFCESEIGFELAIARLDANGSLSANFASNGMSALNGGYVFENIEGIDNYTNGSLLVCATYFDTEADNHGGMVYRLTAAGNVDPTFNNDETLFLIQSSESFIQLKAIGCVVLNNGSGYAAFSREDDDLSVMIVKFLNNGDLDSSFGDGGYKEIVVSSFMDMKEFTTDGSNLFLVGNISSFDFQPGVVIKLDPAGNFSSGFGNGETACAIFACQSNNDAQAVTFDNEGNIYISGISNGNDIFVSKLNSSGNLVTGFGNLGTTTVSEIATNFVSTDIGLSPEGNIIVAGTATIEALEQSYIARFTAEGELDTSFDNNGFFFPEFNMLESSITGIHVLNDGSILTTGSGKINEEVERMLCAKFLVTTTGIYDLTVQGPEVFPNPTNDIIHVSNAEGNISSIRIFDISGKLIRQEIMNAPQFQLDISDLNTGKYLFQGENAAGQIWTRVVVKM
jgi:uncharacterized delta-60 repeat protein